MEQDSKMEEASAVPDECEKEVGSPAVQEDGANDAEPSSEDEDYMKEAMSSALQDNKNKEEFSAELVDERKEAETPAAQEDMNTAFDGNSAEKCSDLDSGEKKTPKVMKVKQKIPKKSPAGSLLKTREVENEPEDVKKEAAVSAAQEVKETPEAGKSAEKCSKSNLPIKKTSKVLKVKRKIAKKSAGSLLKSNKAQGSLTVEASGEKNKSVLQVDGESSEKKIEDADKLNEKGDLKNSVSKEEHIEKSEETPNSQEKISGLKNSCQEEEDGEKSGPLDKSKDNQEIKRNDNVENVQREEKIKKKLGGLIFMCSKKTKPDCFRYHVMGVSPGKQDLVLGIKPGLKLFLYDFDLKLLYGIYKASSSGGMKLESRAFRGAFPAQVRFKVFKDCVPLPERVFKKAIKENYYAKNKFTAELTMKQVRKLLRLFRPAGSRSSAAAVRSSPRAPTQARNVNKAVKEVRSRGPKSKGTSRNRLAHEKDRRVASRDKAPRHREEASRDFYRSEKDYRIYGLRRERREEASHDFYPSEKRGNVDRVLRPAVETYHKDYDGSYRDYHLRHPEPRYRNEREIVHSDPVYFTGTDYPVYSTDPRPQLSPPRAIFASGAERYSYDPYPAREYAPPIMDSYRPPLRREERTSPTYPLRRYYVVDAEPARHAADALSYYNQRHYEKPETEMMPVSSRYSLGGTSYSYR